MDLVRLHQAYRRVFDTEDGLAVLEDLEARGGLWRPSLAEDPQRTAFNEGRRSMVLHVRHMCDEQNFKQNMKEMRNDQ